MVTFLSSKKVLGGVRLNFQLWLTFSWLFGLEKFLEGKEKRGLRWSAGGQLLEIQSNHQQHLLAERVLRIWANSVSIFEVGVTIFVNFRPWFSLQAWFLLIRILAKWGTFELFRNLICIHKWSNLDLHQNSCEYEPKNQRRNCPLSTLTLSRKSRYL